MRKSALREIIEKIALGILLRKKITSTKELVINFFLTLDQI